MPESESELTILALPVNVQDALEATKIAAALTHSFRSGQPVYFDDRGEAILA
jgi:myo-inositol 2-dehydrogenase/D-chiro-inositol 1-dehydrogenase